MILQQDKQAARAFETRQQSLAGLAPSVAAQDALQKQAASLAASGVGSYQPFINQAQQLNRSWCWNRCRFYSRITCHHIKHK